DHGEPSFGRHPASRLLRGAVRAALQAFRCGDSVKGAEMTDRQRIVEVMAQAFTEKVKRHPMPSNLMGAPTAAAFWTVSTEEVMGEILAALEAAGYAIYRPDDCEGVTVEVMNVARGTGPIDGFYAAGT